jgi:hypothetical protein
MRRRPKISAIQTWNEGLQPRVLAQHGDQGQSYAIRGEEHRNFNDIGRRIIMSPRRWWVELHDLAMAKNFTSSKVESTDCL